MPLAHLDDQTAVDYLTAGDPVSGQPDVVLIHGTGGSAVDTWGHLLGPLSADRRVIAPNYAGSGDTTDHGGRLELSELVEQVAAAAADAGVTRYDVVGFSLGAVVGASLAATYPDRVRRLVPIAPWASSADPRVQLQFQLWRRLHATDPVALAEHLTLSGFSPTYLARRPAAVVDRAVETTLATLAPGIGRQAELDQRIDITEALGRITSSTLVIGCRQDQMVPVEHARALVAPIRWSDYVEFDTGHLVLFEQPAELVATILNFLDKPERRKTPRPD